MDGIKAEGLEQKINDKYGNTTGIVILQQTAASMYIP